MAVSGLGLGMVMAPVTTVVMASTPVQQSGMGAGINSTMRQIGSVIGVSVLGAILQNQLATNIGNALAQVPQIPAAVRDQIIQNLTSGSLGFGATNIPSSVPAALRDQLMTLFKTQFANSLNTSMRIGIIVILLGTVVSLFVSGGIRRQTSNPSSSPNWQQPPH